MDVRTLALTGLLTWAALPVLAIAGPCDAYFRFDGDLSDSGSNGFSGQMVAVKGAPATPEFVEGKFGKALKLDGSAAMRAFIDLSYDLCPQVTYTAWIKVEPLPNQMILGVSHALHSMISGTGMSLRVRGDDLWAYNSIFPNAGWMFIAGTWNADTGKVTLHWRNRVIDGQMGTSDRETPPAIWLGALNDDLHFPAKQMVIDEFRVISRSLGHEQIMALQDSASSGTSTVAHVAEAVPLATPVAAGGAGAACAAPGDCPAGSYCAVDGSCHPDSHRPMAAVPAGTGSSGGDPLAGLRERNAREAPDIDYDRPPDLLSGQSSSGSGDPIAELRERSAREAPDIEYDRPPDLLSERSTSGGGSSSTGSGTGGGSTATGGAAEEVQITIGEQLLGFDYIDEPRGDYRVCTSFAEVVADLASKVRDEIVEYATTNGCDLITKPVSVSRAAQGAEPGDYSSAGFQEQLLAEVYGACVAGTSAASRIPDTLLGFWNSKIASGGWATIGPRELKIEATNSGNLIAPGDRKFITSSPILGTDRVTLGIEELDGRARVHARICTVTMNNYYGQLHVFTFNETPEERANQAQTILQDLDDVGEKFLIVKLDAEGTPDRNFKYEIKVYRN